MEAAGTRRETTSAREGKGGGEGGRHIALICVLGV